MNPLNDAPDDSSDTAEAVFPTAEIAVDVDCMAFTVDWLGA